MIEVKLNVTDNTDGSNDSDSFMVRVADESRIDSACDRAAREWVTGGDYPTPCNIPVSWVAEWRDANGEEWEQSGSVTVAIEVDHETLIRAVAAESSCGDSPDDHDWEATYEVEGGCRENPGVWSHGRYMTFADHCTKCGLRRSRTEYIVREMPQHEVDTCEYNWDDSHIEREEYVEMA